ncbi:MAG: NUDIX domain-containing protein [Deltaproteobacteria bacterium]|nr:NUDIX domain-containing protein [Deltaproteobacteria bacterium]
MEKVFRHGKVRLYCGRCDTIHYENPLPATASLVLDGDGQLLLVKRGMDPGKGKWGLPGGFVEADEAPGEGVLRELKEETGLTGEVERLIDVVYEDSPFYGPLIIIGYKVTPMGGDLMAGDDAVEVRYFPLNGLPRVAFDSHQTLIEKIERIGN